MAKPFKALSGLIVAALASSFVAGCGDTGVDMEINSPLLEAAGVNLMGKRAPEPNLPDRPTLVMPPKTGDLPQPGPRQYAAVNSGNQWPTDPEEAKKQAAKNAEAEREKYCQQGDFSGKGNIDEFRKNTGQDTRCRPKWMDNALGTTPDQNKR